MFTPEFIDEERGEVVLVSNHSLASAEAVQFSIAFNKARVVYGRSQVPNHIREFRVIYDIRGQKMSADEEARICIDLQAFCRVEFMR